MNNHDDKSALTSFAVGTPGFAPPEQMAMRPIYSSDVYSLGVTCLYLLTGKSPKELNYNPQTGELDWQSCIHVSPGYSKILEKMMAISVRDRFNRVEEVEAALAEMEQNRSSQMMNSMAGSSVTAPRHSRDRGRRDSSSASPSSRLAARIRAQQQRGCKRRIWGWREFPSENRPMVKAEPPFRHGQSQPALSMQSNLQSSISGGERDFSGRDLRNVQLPKCQLKDVNFQEAQLQKANFQGGHLIDIKLGRTNLSGASFTKAKMINAYLSFADLESVDFRGADLSFAHLNNANFEGSKSL